MTKAELIKEVAQEIEMTQVDANKFYKGLEDVIKRTLADGDDEIKLGFATIKVTRKEAYTARNPRNQEPVDVPARNVGKITLSAPVKDSIAQ